MKAVKRLCPSCNKEKVFRQDVLKCPQCASARSATSDTLPPTEREAHLRTEIKRLTADNTRLRKSRGFLRELTDQIASAVTAADPPPLNFTPTASEHSPLTAVLMLSDWHIGEVIEADETEGFGTFNWAIAQQRVDRITTKFLEQVEMFRASFNIPRLCILGLGDWVSGDIHSELLRTNEFPLPVQAANAGHLFAEAVIKLAPHFQHVKVVEVGADNHGRLQPKPQFKQKSANNMSFLVYTVANARLSALKNVDIEFPAGLRHVVNLDGVKYLAEHGDTIKSWQGIPYMGMSRHTLREGFKRMRRPEIAFDYLTLGHFHVPAIIEGGILVNGSLSGTSEFDHGVGRHSAPAQVSFLSHPRWGAFCWTAWRAE